MRLRIQTLPPLPGLKAWFIPAAHHGLLSSIDDFKAVLSSSVTVLRDAGVRREDVQLLLDDFELLDESRFDEALRDGDLVIIKSQPQHGRRPTQRVKAEVKEERLLSRKRKRHSENGRSQEKRRKRNAGKSEKSSSDSDNDSSSSTSSSPASSSNSSSSSSSSSSTSSSSEESDSSNEPASSSPSSAPSVQLSKPSLQKPPPKTTSRRNQRTPVTSARKSQPEALFVPPGQGKPTTHARNLRRKRLRAAQPETRAIAALEAASSSISPPQGLSDINAMPLGSRTLPQPSKSKGKEKRTHVTRDDEVEARLEAEVEDRREVMMASLGNKNKKKGYKHFLMGPVPKKVVFNEEEVSEQPSQISAEAGPSSQPASALKSVSHSQVNNAAPTQEQRQLPCLIPPSEIQERGELPPNMFVTSVDVEADLWNSNGKNKKNKKKATSTAQHLDDYTYANDEDYEADLDVTLSYGNGDIEMSTEAMDQPQLISPSKISDFDWDQAEQRFDNATKIARLDQLKQARIVGWKNLELNPQTFTPEILLIASKILDVSDLTSSVKVQRLLRSVNPDSGFSGFLAPVEPGDEGEVEGEVEEYKWIEIESLDWRVLQAL